MPTTPLLEVRGVSKSFGAVAAVRDVSFPLYAGEVHALVGENGAGKSTIVKMLAGVHRPDAGHVELDGGPLSLGARPTRRPPASPSSTRSPRCSPTSRSRRTSSWAASRSAAGAGSTAARSNAAAAELFARLGVPIDPERPARGLSIADQQIVEIAKALSLDARVIVMDEPTAALSGVEVERLFAVARSLRDDGAAVLFISHRFEEITALCDRVTIMRDGAHVSTDPLADLTVDEIVRRMVGRALGTLFPKTEVEPGDVVLEVEGLSRARRLHRRLVRPCAPARSSRSPAWSARAAPRSCGRCSASTRATPAPSASPGASCPRTRRRPRWPPGLALVPEDRRQQGLVMDLSIQRNVTQTRLRSLARLGLLVGDGERRLARGVDRPAADQVPAPRRPGAHALRGQPAEGRARQVARHRAAGADRRRADARHRHRHQGRGAPADVGPGGRRRRRPDGLVRAARGARHGRPRARHARGPAGRGARPRRGRARSP